MQKMTEEVVVVKTIAQQIIDAPVESVIVVKYPTKYASIGSVGDPIHSDALVKTGGDGYKTARGNAQGYMHHEDIAYWVNTFPEGTEFYII